MAAMIRRTVRLLLIVLLIPVEIYLLMLFVVHLPPVQNQILSYVEKQVNPLITGGISIHSFRTDLITILTIRDIKSVSKNSDNSVYLKKVTVTFSLLPLIHREIALKTVHITDGTFIAFRDMQGDIHFPLLPADSLNTSPVPQWKVTIDSILLENSKLAYIDKKTDLETVINGVTSHVSFSGMDSLNIWAGATGGYVQSPWWEDTLTSLLGKATVSHSLLAIRALSLVTQSSKMNISGSVALQPETPFNLQASLSTTLDPIPENSTFGRNVDGHIKLEMDAKGILRELFLSVVLESYRLSYQDYTADTVYLKVVYDADSLVCTSMVKSGSITALTDISMIIPNLIGAPSIHQYTLDSKIQGIGVKQILKSTGFDRPAMDGIMNIDISAQGKQLTTLPDFATLHCVVWEADPPEIDTILVDALLRNEQWWIDVTAGSGNNITGHGNVDSKGAIDGMYEGQFINPALLTGLFMEYPVSGSVSITGQLHGSVQKPVTKATIVSDQLEWRGAEITSLGAIIGYDNGVFIEQSCAKINAHLEKLAIPSVKDLSGTLEASIRAEGPLSSICARMQFSLDNPSWRQLRTQRAGGNLIYNNKTLWWDTLLLENDTMTLTLAGCGTTEKNNISVYSTGNFSVRGLPAGSFVTTGTFNNDSLTSMVSFDTLRLSPLFETAHFSPLLNGTVYAKMDFGHQTSCVAQGSAGFEFSQIMSNPPDEYRYHGIFTYNGKLISGSVNITGADSQSVLLAKLHSQPPGIQYCQPYSLPEGTKVQFIARSFAYKDIARIWFPQVAVEGVLDADAYLLRNSGVWELGGWVSVYADTLIWPEQNLSAGESKVHAALAGTINQPLIEGSLSGQALTFRDQFVSNLHASAKLSRDKITVDTLYALFNEGGSLAVSGEMPFGSQELSVRSNMSGQFTIHQFPIVVFDPFIPQVNVRNGMLSGKGTFVVRGGQVFSEGNLDVNDLKFIPQVCDREFGPFNAQFSLSADSVLLNKLAGNINGGELVGDGFVKFGKGIINNFRITGSTENMRIECINLVDLGIEHASATVSKENGLYFVSADISLDDTRIEQMISIPSIVENVLSVNAPHTLPALYQNIRLRVSVVINRNLFIDTNAGRALIDGAVVISGSLAQPQVNGTLQLEEGSITYLDREFAIEEGTIRQFDPEEINPQLDITATSDLSTIDLEDPEDYTITVTISGTLREPQIVLVSQPPLQEEQIINLLTIGALQGEGGLQAGASELVSKQLTGAVTQSVEQLLGVENITVSGNIFSTGENGLTLSIRENLTSRLTLTYQTDFFNIDEQLVRIRYRLFPNVHLTGTASTTGNSGIGIRFLWRR